MTAVSLPKGRQEGEEGQDRRDRQDGDTGQERRDETEVRARILDAAFAAFMKNGYAASSTLEMFAAMVNVAGEVPVDGSSEASRALQAA